MPVPFHIDASLRYARAGWAVFILSRDDSQGKIPLHSCPRCDFRNGAVFHDRASCGCLVCHGFYAATTNESRILAMHERAPFGRLAVRTGLASGFIVLDAEAHARPGEETGVENLDNWESWTGGTRLPPTLTAMSVSGGVHKFYKINENETFRGNRILPGIDIKAESGYVGIVDGRTSRRWVEPILPMAQLPGDVSEWIRNRQLSTVGGGGSGGGISAPDGYDFNQFKALGCPDGYREYFFNDLLFRLKKNGVSSIGMMEESRRHWEKCEQPPTARWYMPWEDVEYKIARVSHEVKADEIDPHLMRWLKGFESTRPADGGRGPQIIKRERRRGL